MHKKIVLTLSLYYVLYFPDWAAKAECSKNTFIPFMRSTCGEEWFTPFLLLLTKEAKPLQIDDRHVISSCCLLQIIPSMTWAQDYVMGSSKWI